jgi:6-phosphogluconolactonase (cycloisomerase 2 family)
MPRYSWAQGQAGKTVFYVAVGAELHRYGVDGQALTLAKEDVTHVPEAVQYIWIHPSKPLMYVAFSNRYSTKADNNHGVIVYTIDQQTGALTPFKQPLKLTNRPVHITLDPAGQFLLVACNIPAELFVYRLQPDGAPGEQVQQTERLDFGIYDHQVRVAPSGHFVVLCTRGNDPTSTTPEDPGAIKVFRFKDGVLSQEVSVTRGNGLGFGPRHVDFHPSKPWMFVSMERNNELLTYGVQDEDITPAPLFTKPTVEHPERRNPVQYVGPIHVHPSGKFVYLANRSDSLVDFQGKKVHGDGENSVAVFSIDPNSGEPTLIQTAPTQTFHCRTFSIHPNGRMLVTASVAPLNVREGDAVHEVPAGLTVFGVGDDGKLTFARKYDVAVGDQWMFWCGMVAL